MYFTLIDWKANSEQCTYMLEKIHEEEKRLLEEISIHLEEKEILRKENKALKEKLNIK